MLEQDAETIDEVKRLTFNCEFDKALNLTRQIEDITMPRRLPQGEEDRMNIDSDTLLEFVRENEGVVHEGAEETGLYVPADKLRAAIHSGELAAKPLQVYAKVPDGFVGPGSIRGGNMFEVYNDDGIGFNFNANGGCNYANWIGSNHLNGGNWERVEK